MWTAANFVIEDRRLCTVDLSPYCFLLHNGLYDVTVRIPLNYFIRFLTNCFIVFIFLMMTYD